MLPLMVKLADGPAASRMANDAGRLKRGGALPEACRRLH